MKTQVHKLKVPKLTGRTISFRPSSKTREQLEAAHKVGISLSEVINAVLDRHLTKSLRKVATAHLQKIREAQKLMRRAA